ncbi:hypothetical protein [Methylobacterium persicinum]|uniref:Uncharacterized protein n=1 Tax=Methylobacterium persicinum TaxID=374426 RepID=A0ABU0HK02_9HYPH|nr:hypothetical protein [Methylobacterium persicinum]MDQ0441851.1 hypothetical protein [Methylobacterium persicinum]GJE38033.1 hypothetical protein KHHGKMAE_2099 [Methylobacterium persicinum]
MTVRTKHARNDTPAARPRPGPGPGRRARKRSAARKALDRTMGRLAAPAGPANPVGATHAAWDEPPLPLLLDGDFDHDDDGAVTLALRLHQAVRDEEDGWAQS